MIKRFLCIALSSFVVCFCVTPLAFAYFTTDPILVTSDIQAPVPEINVVGSDTTYVQYYVQQTFTSSVPQNFLYKITFTVPSSTDVIFRLDHKQFVCINTTAAPGIAYNVAAYDIASGKFLTNTNLISESSSYLLLSGYSSAFKFRNGYFPVDSAYNNEDVFGFPITNISVSSSSQGSNSYQTWDTNHTPFVKWLEPSNDVVIRSRIPQPLSDLHHMYFADDLHLYQLNIDFPTFYQSVGLQANNLTASEFFDQCFVELKKRDATHVTITIKNRSEHSFNAYLSSYDVITGEYIQTTKLSVAGVSNSSGDEIVVDYSVSLDDPIHKGIWYTGFLNTDGLLEFDKLRISWSDTIDYSSDFQQVNSLLGYIESDLLNIASSLNNIEDILPLIRSSIDSIYNLIQSNFNWLSTTYFNTITSKWDITKSQLDSVISLLQGQVGQPTQPARPDVQDGVSDYIQSESGFMDSFNSNGSEIDSIFNDISGRFNSLSSSFAVVSQLFQSFVLENTFVLPLILFSLAFGLVMLIIGRKAG